MPAPPKYRISWTRTDVVEYEVTLTLEQLADLTGVCAREILSSDPTDLVELCELEDQLCELDGDDHPVVEPRQDFADCRREVTLHVI